MAGPIRPSAPFVVCFGGEDFFLDADIGLARSWPKRRPVLLDGSDFADYEIVSMCEAETSEGTPRTLIIDNANKVKGDKYLNEYIEKKSSTDLSVILVPIVRADKLSKLWSAAASKGKGFERKKLKTWDDNNEVVAWIADVAARLRVNFAKGENIAEVLYRNVGPDLYRLTNELKKLAIFVGESGTITKEHIAKITSLSVQVTPFMIADATLAKESKKALNGFSILYKNEGDEALVPVVYALMRQVEKALIARRLLNKGTPESDVAPVLGLNPYSTLFKKSIAHARKHDVGDLVRHMGRLCKLDGDVKGPASSKRTLVELAVLAIAG